MKDENVNKSTVAISRESFEILTKIIEEFREAGLTNWKKSSFLTFLIKNFGHEIAKKIIKSSTNLEL